MIIDKTSTSMMINCPTLHRSTTENIRVGGACQKRSVHSPMGYQLCQREELFAKSLPDLHSKMHWIPD